jgi:hypothetical protein
MPASPPSRRRLLGHAVTALAGATGLGLFVGDDAATDDGAATASTDDGDAISPDVAVVGSRRRANGHVVPAGDPVTFDASETESRARIEAFQWNLDGEPATGDRVQRTWPDGDYSTTITLGVTDAAGRTATRTARVAVASPSVFNAAPTPVHDVTPARTYDDGYIVSAGDRLTFDATDSRDRDGEIASVEWAIRGDVKQGAVVEHAFRRAGNHEVALSVIDDDGATRTVPIPVHVTCSTPNPHTAPDSKPFFNAPSNSRTRRRPTTGLVV